MFVLTAKLSKPKLIAFGVILAAVLLLIIVLAAAGGHSDPGAAAPAGETNDQRVAWLATFGWSVNAEPTQMQKVRIPETADNKVFARYNELQLSQGFDLTGYAGQEVMRYVYEILNYPEATAPVYASLLVCDGVIIGGDITDSAADGVIHGFRMPAESAPTESGTDATASSSETAASDSEATEEPTEEPTEPST